ncbi:MAG: TonB-dependent receptor [Ignavibacteriales bacterium]|nr:hypothetical protein [Ignavibacteriaceae bacterium]MBW7873026.1 TonB-dependent receptor [Ignavibacteria bacterium]MCZ2142346.1 TonB-dependent receptor [Ignavibacteriales bacterium]OQY73727.1 MAG: hypothetical protein B6D45_07735 [Ignavibacteriales bacterium UTCHB3]WKZ73509.1 MAG: TonB-dependent receptor [Ignavibacteriaceae bacterium]
MRVKHTILWITFLLFSYPILGQTGKLSGIIKDQKTGETLIGATILIDGTKLGAKSDNDGYYAILNVPPGKFTVRASMIGYATQAVTEVQVNINQTTILDFALVDESITTQEVVVIADKPIIEKDVSSSVVNISMEDVATLPIVSVAGVIGLQAGVQGLTIRGGGSDQTAFMINGITFRDERDNSAYTGISFTSVEEIQVQTGGFNAEYGNIRSGLVNVVTTEGKRDKYNVVFLGRYRAPGMKNWGDMPNDPNSYFIRPYIDPAVAFTGTTSGAWDLYTQAQYQEFRGWNKVSEELLSDDDPTNDLTPEAAQQLFLWQHRKPMGITQPDYDMDFSISGPVPVVSSALGDLRFLASYRTTREMYAIPLSTNAYQDWSTHVKVTSDIAKGMKFTVEGLLGKQAGTGSSRSGGPGIFRSAAGILNEMDIRAGASYLDARVFATDYWAPTSVDRKMLGAKFVHVISPTTFYEVQLNVVGSEYNTNPGFARNTGQVVKIGNNWYDESPYGYPRTQASGIGSAMNMGLGYSNSRDTSRVYTWSARFDYSSQLNQIMQIKTGFEFVYTDNAVNYGLTEPSLPTSNSHSKWQTYPVRGAIYGQTKLEFEGMIANIGLRLDYSHAGGEWYVYDPYNKAFSGAFSPMIDQLLPKEPTEKIISLSPRLGVAFPITVNSKLFFNYGHFRSMPAPENLYLIRRNLSNQAVTRLANPNNPLPKTVAYELGYEQNIADMFMVRVAGYYKDVTDETRLVGYVNRDNSVSYSVPEPNLYRDIRGFEITLTKNRGDWITGFVNYTYMVSSYGYFGLPTYYENAAQQRETERNTALFGQVKPVPRPYGRANLDIFTPAQFGPAIGGVYLLEDLRINLLGTWSSGTWFSWTGPGGTRPGFSNNIQWNDFWNVDVRISKTFRFGPASIEIFADISNVLNIKFLDYRAGFFDQKDYDAYMQSLHLPAEYSQFGYNNIVGTDKPGDVRTGEYIPWDENASEAQKDEWRKNKSYIDMPNLPYTAFTNPRVVYWGLRLIFEIK